MTNISAGAQSRRPVLPMRRIDQPTSGPGPSGWPYANAAGPHLSKVDTVAVAHADRGCVGCGVALPEVENAQTGLELCDRLSGDHPDTVSRSAKSTVERARSSVACTSSDWDGSVRPG